jgi:hypothetical protein
MGVWSRVTKTAAAVWAIAGMGFTHNTSKWQAISQLPRCPYLGTYRYFFAGFGSKIISKAVFANNR